MLEKTGNKSINININSNMLGDVSAKGKQKENNFSVTDMILSMETAMDFDEKNNNKTEVEQFIRKFNTICSSLKESKKENHGFFWDYYVPYFIEMKDKKLVEAFSYVAFASSTDPDVSKVVRIKQKKI